MMKSTITLLIYVCMLGLASCKSMTQLTPLSLLKNYEWVLTSLSGEEQDGSSDRLPYLDFMDGGKLSGFTGCNSFTGNFILEGDVISLEPIAMTKRACPDDKEARFTDALARGTHFAIDEDKLTIFENGDTLMVFSPKQRP